MKVLFVYKPYFENDFDSGSMQEKIRGSFHCAFGENNPNYEFDVIHFGLAPGLISTPKEMNEEIIRRDFDVCIVSEELHFSVEMNVIKRLGKKLFLCCWDNFIATDPDMHINFLTMMKMPRIWGEHKWPIPLAEASQYCNVLAADYGKGEIFPNVYGIGNALDTRIYNTNNTSEKNRNINVGFNGTFYTAERDRYFEIFRKTDIPIEFTGSCNKTIFPAQVLSDENYADIYKRTKISLQFTESIFGPNNKQRKGRPFEIAACGSFMLSTYPEAYKFGNSEWFTEGVHYDSIDESNCIDKIEYYLANPSKRIAMADAMHKHFLDHYSPLQWWKDIFKWAGAE